MTTTVAPQELYDFKQLGLGIESPYEPRYDNFIGGRFVAPVRGDYFPVISPIVGQPFTEVARSTAEDVELALDAAHAARAAWGATSAAHRALILNRIADRMEENLGRLALAETIDTASRSAKRPRPTFR